MTGNLAFTDTIKTWYKDSIAIQELHKIRRTTYDGRSTVDYPVFAYRLMNLRTKWFDFSSLSDTATVLKSGSIPFSKLEVEYVADTIPGKIISVWSNGKLELRFKYFPSEFINCEEPNLLTWIIML
jgi:hypothetical protein